MGEHLETAEPLARLVAHVRMLAEFGQHAAPAASAGWRYRSWAALLLDVGQVFEPVPSGTDPVPGAWRGEPRTCYISAATWAISDDLPYVEGMACTDLLGLLGTEHAWVAGPHGEALDPTWRPGQGTAYVGIAFTAAYRQQHLRPALLHPGNHDGEGLALLRDGIPPSALVASVGRAIPPVPERVAAEFTASWLPGEAS